MDAIKSANLALRFGLELGALAAGYWGATVDGTRAGRLVLAVAAPLAVAAVWMFFVAPGATILTSPGGRFFVEVVVFLSAVVALVERGRVVLAVSLGICYVVNRALMVAWDQ